MVAAAGPRRDPSVGASGGNAPRAKVLESATPLLSEWLADFLELREASRYRNVKSERVLVRTHVAIDPIASLPLRSLTPVILQAFWRRLVERSATTPHQMPSRPRGKRKPLSRSSVANVLTIVRCALERAVQAGHLEHNPARGLSVPRSLGATTALEFEGVLEQPEEVLLLAELGMRAKAGGQQERSAYAMVRFALGTGCRRGELLSLRWRDVHLESGVPFVIVRDSGRGRIADGAAPPKGGKPRRVPLFGMALDAIMSLPRGSASPWVFPGARGGRRKLPPSNALREALLAVGVVRRVRWHDLRHTCATALLEGTRGSPWTVEAVQQLLGHASITTTERYLHARGSLVFAAARAAERAVQPAPARAACEPRRFSGTCPQVPAPPRSSREPHTPLRPSPLNLPLVDRAQAGVATEKQVAMQAGALERGQGHGSGAALPCAVASMVRSTERDTGLEAVCHSLRSRVPESTPLGIASCEMEAAAVSNATETTDDLRRKCARALAEQSRVILKYVDRRGVESATSGIVVEVDGEVVVVAPSPAAPPRRVHFADVLSVEPLETGGAS